MHFMMTCRDATGDGLVIIMPHMLTGSADSFEDSYMKQRSVRATFFQDPWELC